VTYIDTRSNPAQTKADRDDQQPPDFKFHGGIRVKKMGSSQADLLHDSIRHWGLGSHPRYGFGSFTLLFGFFFLSRQRLAVTQNSTGHGQHTECGTGNKKCQQQQNQGRLGAGVPEKMQHHFVGIFQREAKKRQEQAYRK
jgi:hypothetical protein